ncbi:hypothetical protein [Arthrobacter sp. UYEF3]|uniref:hypothetical protein n=1 Tax=Arthrobacter sp. UYEF3 TaxID=1756365 RepID=UPI003392EF28
MATARAVAAAALAVVVGMLTACAGPSSAADRSYRGMISTPSVSRIAPPGAPPGAPPAPPGAPPGATPAPSAPPGAPPGATPAPRLKLGTPVAGWVDRPRRFGVTLWGSSSCPAVPTRIEATAPDRVAIRLEASAQNPCTADLAPTTHEFSVPAGAGTLPLTITLVYAEGEGSTTLVLE